MDGVSPSGCFLPDLISPERTIGARAFDFSRQVAVMAIVNRTPDSFHDQGRTFALEAAVEAVQAAVADGADWVDIGGVPFGVSGREVTEAEELDRVIPVVQAARRSSNVVISVDTYRAEVARQAIRVGANVINDTSGLRDPGVADVVADTDATLVITHSLASPPRTPVSRPSYGDVAAEVAAFLANRVELALSRGVPTGRLVIDPGHDLNKNTFHSLELTRRLSEVARLGFPTLVAVSNKDFIGETLDLPRGQRLEGTIAALVVCILQGARIVRVHDVGAGVAATRMTEAILGWRPPVVAEHNMT
ncbi:MAG TPA: dihydropteroate synthase [Micromonosporaceae bacterium]